MGSLLKYTWGKNGFLVLHSYIIQFEFTCLQGAVTATFKALRHQKNNQTAPALGPLTQSNLHSRRKKSKAGLDSKQTKVVATNGKKENSTSTPV